DHDPIQNLQCSFNSFSAEYKYRDAYDERHTTNPVNGCRVSRSGQSRREEIENSSRRIRSPCGPTGLQHKEKRIEPSPKRRVRTSAHEASQCRLACVERVTNELCIENGLEIDSDRGEPKQCKAVFDKGRRPEKPFATADRCAENDRAGSDH